VTKSDSLGLRKCIGKIGN